MTFGSLFAGIGGLDLGLERAGMECRWQVEIDPFCRRVLEKHWPEVPRYGDIKAITELPAVDLVCGGFPCQPVSLAGKRKAWEDDRWLWPEFARIVRMVRPRFVLVENVPGLLSAGMGDVLGDLAALGYDAEWACITAGLFGASHIRRRVFIVAYPSRAHVKPPIPARISECTFRKNEHIPQAGSRGIFDGLPIPDTGFPPEPDVGRVAHGVPRRVDRLRALGNAVVPQCAEWIGRRIMEFPGGLD